MIQHNTGKHLFYKKDKFIQILLDNFVLLTKC